MNRIFFLIRMIFQSISGSAQGKYDARYSLFQSITSRFGFRIYNKNLSWIADKEYRKVWKAFPEGNDFVHERRFNLYNLAKLVRHLPGDIAECGVFRAAGSYLLLSATASTTKRFYGFDSFEGLSEPNDADKVNNDYSYEWKKHDLASDEERALNNLSQFSSRCTLFRGWIPERFEAVADNRFCLVHIDVDLYEPTRDALEFFIPRLVPGGMIICDDYGSDSCPGARRAMDEIAGRFDLGVAHLTTGQGILVIANGSSNRS